MTITNLLTQQLQAHAVLYYELYKAKKSKSSSIATTNGSISKVLEPKINTYQSIYNETKSKDSKAILNILNSFKSNPLETLQILSLLDTEFEDETINLESYRKSIFGDKHEIAINFLSTFLNSSKTNMNYNEILKSFEVIVLQLLKSAKKQNLILIDEPLDIIYDKYTESFETDFNNILLHLKVPQTIHLEPITSSDIKKEIRVSNIICGYPLYAYETKLMKQNHLHNTQEAKTIQNELDSLTNPKDKRDFIISSLNSLI